MSYNLKSAPFAWYVHQFRPVRVGKYIRLETFVSVAGRCRSRDIIDDDRLLRNHCETVTGGFNVKG
jgi:hypothetical protein